MSSTNESGPDCLVFQPDPREDAVLDENVVKLGIMDHDSVVQTGVQVEQGTVIAGSLVCLDFQRIFEGVTHPEEYCGHVAAPQGGVKNLQAGVEGEGVVPDTVNNI